MTRVETAIVYADVKPRRLSCVVQRSDKTTLSFSKESLPRRSTRGTFRSTQDVVSWTLSGEYDKTTPVLFDAEWPSRSLSREQCTRLVEALAGAFTPGSTVCLHIRNDASLPVLILYPVLFLSILASGCVWTGTNVAYTANELQHHFRSSGTKYVITAEDHIGVVEEAIEATGDNIEIIKFCDLLGGKYHSDVDGTQGLRKYRTLSSLLNESNHLDLDSRLTEIDDEMPAVIMSTSGTTGLPKMLRRTHRAIIEESRATQDRNTLKPYKVRRLYCTPIFHAFSFPEMMINSLRLGFPSYYMGRFDDTFARKLYDFDVTEIMAAPPILLRLAELASRDELIAQQMQSLKMVLCAGAALSAEVRERFLRIFRSSVRIVQVWGMSEGGWFSTFKYPESDTTGSVGRPMAGCKVRLAEQKFDAQGRIIPSELLVRATYMTQGYLNNPMATAETFDEHGWLRTGDIGYVSHGKIYLVDRVKDMIKINGWSVSPAELEAALYKDPRVADAAVVGHGKGIDEHPVAFVVPLDAFNTTSDGVKMHLLKYVSRFKVTKCEVKFIESIPRNPSGKILRKVLRAQLV